MLQHEEYKRCKEYERHKEYREIAHHSGKPRRHMANGVFPKLVIAAYAARIT